MSSSYTWDEVRQHTSPGDLWLVIDNKIYDVSQWMDEHPGGDFVLLQEAGKDATAAFADIGHSLYAEGLLKDYYLGDLRVFRRGDAGWSSVSLWNCTPSFAVRLKFRPSLVRIVCQLSSCSSKNNT